MNTVKHLSYLIIGITLCCINTLQGQGWMKFYDTAFDDYATAVTQTMDEGFLLAGTTSVGNIGVDFSDAIALVRTNSRGDTIWTKTIDFVSYNPALHDQDHESIIFIKKKDNGHFILAGNFSHKENTSASQSYLFLVEIDATGTVLWTKKQHFGFRPQNGGLAPNSLSISNISFTDNEALIISGKRTGSLPYQGSYASFVAKLNPIGDVIWATDAYKVTYNSPLFEKLWSVAGHIQTDDNSVICISNVYNPYPLYPANTPHTYKTVLSKVDSNGHLIESISIDSSEAYRDFSGLSKTSDNKLVLCGSHTSKID